MVDAINLISSLVYLLCVKTLQLVHFHSSFVIVFFKSTFLFMVKKMMNRKLVTLCKDTDFI